MPRDEELSVEEMLRRTLMLENRLKDIGLEINMFNDQAVAHVCQAEWILVVVETPNTRHVAVYPPEKKTIHERFL